MIGCQTSKNGGKQHCSSGGRYGYQTGGAAGGVINLSNTGKLNLNGIVGKSGNDGGLRNDRLVSTGGINLKIKVKNGPSKREAELSSGSKVRPSSYKESTQKKKNTVSKVAGT